jgi:hypothetical protein
MDPSEILTPLQQGFLRVSAVRLLQPTAKPPFSG